MNSQKHNVGKKALGLEVRNLAATNKSCDLEQIILPPETLASTSVKMGVTLPTLREEPNEVMLGKTLKSRTNHT